MCSHQHQRVFHGAGGTQCPEDGFHKAQPHVPPGIMVPGGGLHHQAQPDGHACRLDALIRHAPHASWQVLDPHVRGSGGAGRWGRASSRDLAAPVRRPRAGPLPSVQAPGLQQSTLILSMQWFERVRRVERRHATSWERTRGSKSRRSLSPGPGGGGGRCHLPLEVQLTLWSRSQQLRSRLTLANRRDRCCHRLKCAIEEHCIVT